MQVMTGSGKETANFHTRYRITVARERPVRITATDRQTGTRICGWCGAVAVQLLDCGILSSTCGTVESFEVDKAFLQHLALEAASAQMVLDRQARAPASATRQRVASAGAPKSMSEERWSRLEARLRRLNATLSGPLKHVARLLFSYPGQHLSIADVCSLLAMQGLPVSNREAGTWLDELAARGITQRIEVSAVHVFYDIDTRPHVHIYDHETGKLRDATVQGVITSGSRKLPTCLEITDNNRVRIMPAGRVGV